MSKKMNKKQANESAKSELVIATYSERAFVVFGDTKPLKDMLKSELKLRYNPRLKCGAGWIGSLKHVDEACELLGVKLQKLSEEALLAIGEKRAAEKKAKSEKKKAEAKQEELPF